MRRPGLLSALLAVTVVIGLAACGRTAPKPVSGPVAWTVAEDLLTHCRVRHVEQTHTRRVTLTLDDGNRAVAVEPRIDDMFRVLNKLPASCRPKTVATE